MARKEAARKVAAASKRTVNWKRRWAIGGAALVVVAAAIAIRYSWGPDTASAQLPRPSATTAGPVRSPAPARGSSSAPAPAAGSAAKPQVVAIVNNEPISRQELAHECLRRFGAEVLESLVNKHLIFQACQKQGIVITEQDVENEITAMASKFGLSNDRWLELLQRERDISPDKYRREIIWPTLALRRLAAAETTVSPQELQQAFESEFGPKVKVSMISVGTQAQAEQLRAQAVAAPDSFGDLAKEHSEDKASAAARGLIPPIRRHAGDPNIERVAFSLKEGEISEVLPWEGQFLIFKCERHLAATFVDPAMRAETEQRLRERIADNKLRAAASKVFAALQQQAQIVNVYNSPELRQKMPGVAATINGHQVSVRELGEECILRHGRDVLEGEISRKVLVQALNQQQQAVTKSDLDQEILRAADSYGFVKPDGTPDVEAWIRSVTEKAKSTVDLYVSDAVWPSTALKKLVSKRVEVSQEDMQKGFEANYGPRVEVMAIVLGSQRLANQVWDMARNNPSPQFFSQLAGQYSIEPVSRNNGGEVPPIRMHGGQPAIEKEAFRLQTGELSSIVATGNKFIILKCLGRTEPVVDDFAAVKDELYKELFERKLRLEMNNEFERLKEAAQIVNFLTKDGQAGSLTSTAPAASGPATTSARATGVPATRAPATR